MREPKLRSLLQISSHESFCVFHVVATRAKKHDEKFISVVRREVWDALAKLCDHYQLFRKDVFRSMMRLDLKFFVKIVEGF